MDKRKVLIGCCGSVATIKLPLLASSFLKNGCEVKVVMTEHACHFTPPKDVTSIVKVHLDEDEWATWQQRGDPVVHIELGRWADIFVIAPLDANTLAKLANVRIYIIIVSCCCLFQDIHHLYFVKQAYKICVSSYVDSRTPYISDILLSNSASYLLLE